MVKAKLIDNQEYYNHRKKLAIGGIIALVFPYMLWPFYQLNNFIAIFYPIILISAIIIYFRLRKKLSNYIEDSVIEMREEWVQIRSINRIN